MGSRPRRTAHRSTWKRDGACGGNQHSCLDTGHGDQCCDNDAYCFVSTSGESRCCPLGSNCVADSQCNSKSYYCTRTAATTLISSSIAVNATETGCCGRSCPQPKYFLCPAALGGNCCPYGSECRADGSCVAAASSSATTTTTRIGTGTASGSPTALCPSGGASCTGTALAAEPRLSTTTKTGIAVTVVAGTGVIVGMLAWLWITRRRAKARAAATTASREESSVSEVPGDSVPEAGYFGIGGAAVPSGAARAVPSQPNTPGDIASPVEIDSAAVDGEAPPLPPPRADGAQMVEQSGEVYELPATEVEVNASGSTEEGGERDKETMV
ncbi:hypothetical protein LEL_03783 [Akanthomyces lecanii RCEF 1005]|uniref:Uncharacterized protein n=1 Tax=Akanthomyces lecanii RCEF 1005 TaxID=1081108 RepID=A0A168JDC8_CORDF|nr:hypothetical protein LEL_03783 [Akanthomyces lecanii RCEF 1005]